MKRLGAVCASTLALGLLLASAAVADAPRPHRPDVMGATPDTFNAEWVTGVSQDGGAKGQSIKMTDFAFYSFREWWDHQIADITKIRASWKLEGTNAGGSPRFSLEIASPDAVAAGTCNDPNQFGIPGSGCVVIFLDPAWCSDPVPGGWVESDFTDDTTNCTIFDSLGNSYGSDANGTAWDKVVAAYPGSTVWFMFAIQDATTGTNYLDRVKLDSAFFTKQP